MLTERFYLISTIDSSKLSVSSIVAPSISATGHRESGVVSLRTDTSIWDHETPFVNENDYEEQYRLFDSVMDEIEDEGLIRDKIGRLILRGMERYEKTGDAFPENWGD